MSRFKYLGEIPPHGRCVHTQGPCTQINVPLKNGGHQVIMASDQVHGFTIGADIGVDIMDSRAIRVLQSDVRFAQIS